MSISRNAAMYIRYRQQLHILQLQACHSGREAGCYGIPWLGTGYDVALGHEQNNTTTLYAKQFTEKGPRAWIGDWLVDVKLVSCGVTLKHEEVEEEIVMMMMMQNYTL